MKWFQQNRALGILLIVSGVCILLSAALLYWRWSVWSDAKQTFDQATTERNRLQGLNPFPNDANYRKLQGYLERYNAALDKFKDELKADVAPDPPLAPNEFQSRLREATLAVEARARTNNVKLPDKFQVGFDEFARMMPSTAVAALLGQELSQVQMLINILLDAKVDSITSFRRRPLPEERGASATPTPSPGQRVATMAKPGGICVLAGIGSAGLHKGQLGRIAGNFTAAWRSRFVDQNFESYVTTSSGADLKFLSDLMAEGKVTPFVEKTYSLDQTADALRYFEEGHARGKLVIQMADVVSSAGELTADEYVFATGLWAAGTVRSVGRTREVNH